MAPIPFSRSARVALLPNFQKHTRVMGAPRSTNRPRTGREYGTQARAAPVAVRAGPIVPHGPPPCPRVAAECRLPRPRAPDKGRAASPSRATRSGGSAPCGRRARQPLVRRRPRCWLRQVGALRRAWAGLLVESVSGSR
ncbi:hypothetical protein PVAP13_2KG552430 [Panicum virgatum]|uniref:Uncharacterized protein n=1 Tax=Panicum virgatum TaxID=38727 RepID=A0A8T0WM67_PANVG|nr:hypothetical protein PVAP13_2KG552430 [Panicum virgatum]